MIVIYIILIVSISNFIIDVGVSKMRLKVAIIFGGQSKEHEISLASAAFVIRNIDRSKYDVYHIGITKDGKWFEYNGEVDNIQKGLWEKDEYYKYPNGERILFNKEVDLVFPLLHGLYGEDGTIQGLCKLLRLPCVGSGILSSALCMDKVYSKFILENFDIKVTPYLVISKYEYSTKGEVCYKSIEENLQYPLFIKPSNGGSSLGVSKAMSKEDLIQGINEAFKYDNRVLVERAIDAREIKVAIIGNDEIKRAAIGEVIYDKGKEFFDYELKYTEGQSELITEISLTKEKIKEIGGIAEKAYKLLDCRGMARVDFFVDKATLDIYVNEVNTIPGLTKNSSFPKLWNESNLKNTELIDKLIQLALER